MKTLFCELQCFSSTEHLSQLYTGFGILNKRGLIKTSIKKDKSYQPHGIQGLMVLLNNEIKIFYDLFDGANLYEEFLEKCNYYFKRSFDSDIHEGKKILPYGLNYPVTDKSDFSLRRFFWDIKHFSTLKNTLLILHNQVLLRNKNKVDKFEHYPHFETNPQILFLVRLWNPDKIINNEEKKKERLYINSMRTECIRKLKKEFPKNFIGGVYPNDVALNNHKDLLIDKSVYEKANYLYLMRNSDICLATMGLRKSNGWKLAEYIAGSKAIVSEKLYYQPTGNFKKGTNYIEFNNADECVEKVAELFYDPQKRYKMALANYRYYHEYLRPDILIWNTLQTALMQSN